MSTRSALPRGYRGESGPGRLIDLGRFGPEDFRVVVESGSGAARAALAILERCGALGDFCLAAPQSIRNTSSERALSASRPPTKHSARRRVEILVTSGPPGGHWLPRSMKASDSGLDKGDLTDGMGSKKPARLLCPTSGLLLEALGPRPPIRDLTTGRPPTKQKTPRRPTHQGRAGWRRNGWLRKFDARVWDECSPGGV
jgi:hypothetical protein